MKQVDYSGHPRINALVRTAVAMGDASDALAALDMFIESMRDVYGERCVIGLATQGLPPGSYRIARWRDIGGRQQIGGGSSIEVAEDAAVHVGGFFGGVVATPAPKLLHHVAVRDDPVVGDRLAGLGSFLAVPLYDTEGIYHWIVFGHAAAESITLDELEQTLVRTSLISTTIGSIAAHKRLRAANEWIDGEIEQIAAIQRGLLPQRLPDVPGLSLAASYRTFDRAGGDYYDVFSLPCGDWGLMIADASGHGPAASVVAAMLIAILHTFPGRPERPSDVLEYVNRHLYARNFDGQFVTAIFAIYEPATRRLRYASAGHNQPVLRRPDGSVELLELANGLPLGVDASVDSEEATLTLDPGQTLLLYTDGVVDERNVDDEPFGTERLKKLAARHGDDAEKLVACLADELVRHQGVTKPEDDQTIVAVHSLGADSRTATPRTDS